MLCCRLGLAWPFMAPKTGLWGFRAPPGFSGPLLGLSFLSHWPSLGFPFSLPGLHFGACRHFGGPQARPRSFWAPWVPFLRRPRYILGPLGRPRARFGYLLASPGIPWSLFGTSERCPKSNRKVYGYFWGLLTVKFTVTLLDVVGGFGIIYVLFFDVVVCIVIFLYFSMIRGNPWFFETVVDSIRLWYFSCTDFLSGIFFCIWVCLTVHFPTGSTLEYFLPI